MKYKGREKEYMREYQRKYRDRDREKYNADSRKRYADNKDIIKLKRLQKWKQ